MIDEISVGDVIYSSYTPYKLQRVRDITNRYVFFCDGEIMPVCKIFYQRDMHKATPAEIKVGRAMHDIDAF